MCTAYQWQGISTLNLRWWIEEDLSQVLEEVDNMDLAKSVSRVSISSVGLGWIDIETKGGDSVGAPDFKTANKLGEL